MDYDYEDNLDIDEIEKELTDIEEENIEEIEDDNEENKINILELLTTKKKKNMYFDEEYVKDLILNKYQPYLEFGLNKKGKRVCIDRSKVDKEIEKEIMGNLLLIANAIINKYRYWRFEPLDDLQSEALKAMWHYLPNFVPSKGTAFNLFSLICKRHLLNFTYKNLRYRDVSNVETCFDLSSSEAINYDLFLDDLEQTFLNIINRHYIKERRKKYIELTSILIEYLDKNKRIISKSDLLSEIKSYSYKSTEYKEFIEEMSKYKEVFYELGK